MGEALGIDLRAAACAAARWRDGRIEPCVLGDGGGAPVELSPRPPHARPPGPPPT